MKYRVKRFMIIEITQFFTGINKSIRSIYNILVFTVEYYNHKSINYIKKNSNYMLHDTRDDVPTMEMAVEVEVMCTSSHGMFRIRKDLRGQKTDDWWTTLAAVQTLIFDLLPPPATHLSILSPTTIGHKLSEIREPNYKKRTKQPA